VSETPISRISGCLIGQCLGDALGFPVEGRDAADCSLYLQRGVRRWFAGEECDLQDWSGQYTDDSQLARELLASLVHCNGWRPADYAARIEKIFRENRIVGRGIACDEAARNLSAGLDWIRSGVPAPSAGNGTAMRAAPVGLFFHDDPAEMIRVAHEQGWITHHDPRCSAGSIAIAGGVALALRDKISDCRAFVSRLCDWMSAYDSGFANLVLKLPSWLELSPVVAAKKIAVTGREERYVESWPGISPFVVPSVLWSLYSFLRHRDSYEDAVCEAIAVGGDVDTTAAMTGAISGAYLGLDALPAHLTERLHDKREWKLENLTQLALSCHNCVTSREPSESDQSSQERIQ